MTKKLKRLTINEVKHVAKLAALPVSSDEEKLYCEQLSETLDYVDELNVVDTKTVTPTYQTGGSANKLREDKTFPSLSQDEALKNAKSHNGFFMTNAIWD